MKGGYRHYSNNILRCFHFFYEIGVARWGVWAVDRGSMEKKICLHYFTYFFVFIFVFGFYFCFFDYLTSIYMNNFWRLFYILSTSSLLSLPSISQYKCWQAGTWLGVEASFYVVMIIDAIVVIGKNHFNFLCVGCGSANKKICLHYFTYFFVFVFYFCFLFLFFCIFCLTSHHDSIPLPPCFTPVSFLQTQFLTILLHFEQGFIFST